MADDNKLNNSHKKSNAIDVTKPRPTGGPQSGGAMPSGPKSGGGVMPKERVEVTDQQRQHELLTKLSEKHATTHAKAKEKADRSGIVKTVIAILLIVVVIALAVVFMFVISDNKSNEESFYELRASLQIDNKSTLTVISESGREQLREIEPGDILDIGATVQNANNFGGDPREEKNPPNVYVRFKIYFILNYADRFDVLKPKVNTDVWYRYNAEDESKHINGVKEDDNWYYFCGRLAFQQKAQLFSEVLVDGNSLTVDDGGHYGQIVVVVEVIEADENAIKSEGMWNTAPREWVSMMTAPIDNGDVDSVESDI